MVNKGNHPKMAELFRLVKYSNLPIYIFGNFIIPADFHIFQRGKAQPPTRLLPIGGKKQLPKWSLRPGCYWLGHHHSQISRVGGNHEEGILAMAIPGIWALPKSNGVFH